jgi:hypothetical protein
MKITEWTEETIREHMFTEVEVKDIGDYWTRAKLDGFRSGALAPFNANGSSWVYMRLITKPKKRLMTIKELWGKTLVSRNGCLVTVMTVDSFNQIMMLDSWNTVEEAHLNDWRLADQYFDFGHATSLEVEE